MTKHTVAWRDAGYEPQNPPNPQFPDGMDVDVTGGRTPACRIELPYPAKRIGHYLITCSECGMTMAITTAGRADDPKSITVPCKRMVQ